MGVSGSGQLLWPFFLPYQFPVRRQLPDHQDYFGVASDKIFSEFSDHCNPFDKLPVEGFKSIAKIAAGSVVSLGLRTISGGPSFGVCAQPVNASKVSTRNGIAHRLR